MDIPLIWAAAETASSGISLSTVLNVTWSVILVLVGINMLIIVHEFGHFIVARMCGVRCDKFYIWFDIYGWKIFKFKWGDTEYGLGVLPLGGYVKMFGQEDSPGAIKAEIERAKKAGGMRHEAGDENLQSTSALQPPASSLQPEQIAELEKSLYAKDSYLSKSVPQRMAIIVAGVVMNVIFAFICGVGAFLFGVEMQVATIGSVVPGSAAWRAGIQPGDRILAVAGHQIHHFGDIRTSVVSSLSDKIELQIERPGMAEPITVFVSPEMKKKALVAQIGVGPAASLKLDKFTPVSKFRFPLEDDKQLKGGETLVAVNGEKISSHDELQIIEQRLAGQPIKYTFERRESAGKTSIIELELPPVPERTLGFHFEMGPVTAVRPEAEKAGFAIGDVIQTIDGKPVNPLRLAGDMIQAANSGVTSSTIVVKRGNETKTIEMPLVFDSMEKRLDTGGIALGSNLLGVAYDVVSNVGASPTASLPIGGTVVGLTIPDDLPQEILRGCKPFGRWVENGFRLENEERDLPFAVIVDDLVRVLPVGTEVILHVKNGDVESEHPLTVANDPAGRFESERGLNFAPETFLYKADSFGQAIQMGWNETANSLLAVYSFIKNMTYGQATGTSRISVKAMGGPIAIVNFAYHAAMSGTGTFLLLLCLLGANLAVINILPIPVLDGGHLVFLAYEAIFRKPPNETVQVILSYIGLFLLLALMVWVFSLDLGFVKR